MRRLWLASVVVGGGACACTAGAQGNVPPETIVARLARPLVRADSTRQLHPGLRIAVADHAPPRLWMQAPNATSILGSVAEPSNGLSRRPLLLKRADPHFVRTLSYAVGASAVVSLGDARMMRAIASIRSPDGAGRKASILAASLGGIVPLSAGTLMWAGGTVFHRDVMRQLGSESTQAVLLSGALTIGIKGLVGRMRPNASPDDPDEYRPGRGFMNASSASFPSGHTSAAFAMATVLSRELSARFPRERWWIRGVLYGAAGSVGLARMYQNAHWPSDVVTGAALGTLSGMQVLSWNGDRR